MCAAELSTGGIMPKEKVVCIDLDDTVLQRTEGILLPLPGAIEAIQRLLAEGWEVIYYTAHNIAELSAVAEHLMIWGINGQIWVKPRAHVFVDDRALQFNNNWEETYQEIVDFEPYYYRQTN